jgi:hypothetical protein
MTIGATDGFGRYSLLRGLTALIIFSTTWAMGGSSHLKRGPGFQGLPAQNQRGRGADDGSREPVQHPDLASAAPIDLQAYLAQLSRLSRAIGRLQEHPDEAGALRRQLPPTWLVSVQGETFSVPTHWLLRALAAVESSHRLTAAACRQIQSHLDALEADGRALLTTPGVDRAAARAALNAILQRREFRQIHGPSWLHAFLERTGDWMTSLLRKLFGKLGVRIHLGELFLWGVVSAIGLVLTIWLVRMGLARQGEVIIDLRGSLVAAKTSRDWMREARTRAESGDYRGAIHRAYWAVVCRLAELGAWRLDWTRTPREYLHLLAGREAERESLAVITRCFERVWYGEQPASAADFQSVAAELKRLETLGRGVSVSVVSATSR